MSGIAPPVAMGAFLMGLRIRGETTDEIAGAAKFLREPHDDGRRAPRLHRHRRHRRRQPVVRTMSRRPRRSLRRVPAPLSPSTAIAPLPRYPAPPMFSPHSASSSNVPPVVVSRAIADAGVGFLWAPLYHPTFMTWAPIRNDLGLRTIFNLLGPLCNPARSRGRCSAFMIGSWSERSQKFAQTGFRSRVGRAWRRRHGRADDDGRDARCRSSRTATFSLLI